MNSFPYSDRSLDPVVALLMATDLSIDELLSVRRGDVYSGSLLVVQRAPLERRPVLVPLEARWALSGYLTRTYDPDAPLVTSPFGGSPTHDQVLRSVADHLEILRTQRETKAVRQAMFRLGRVFRQGYLAA